MAVNEICLVNMELSTVPCLTTDVLVIGSGLAGLTAALAAAERGRSVLLVTKDQVKESNSSYAQGGIAVAMGGDDTPELHLEDTLTAGAGLCDEAAVRVLVEEGVRRCQQLVEWQVPFDRVGGEISFTMEGAHRRRRVIHASGDATGRVVMETLARLAATNQSIRILEQHFTIDLLQHGGECYGAVVQDTVYGRFLEIRAGATVVATGGLGQIYRETTNPEVATGDGYAVCFRAGAVLRDMEFVQFHPTTLYLAGAPRFLISEAVRGEGAYLLNENGERFMSKYSERLELAPRDVVSQAIFKELNASGTTNVYLDLRHLAPALIRARFPTIQEICNGFGLDIARELIPVRPAVHYMMGGVKTDLDAQTAVRRLFAAGEVASTGVHGANRLASNSLLEALVFGCRAGENAAAVANPVPFPLKRLERSLVPKAVPLHIDDMLRSLKSLTWRLLGVFRGRVGLLEAERNLGRWEGYVLPEQFQARRGFEIQNMLTLARVMARAALLRTESRGAHQRFDYPEPDPSWARHSEFSLGDFAD